MATKLNKAVSRVSMVLIRDGGKVRHLVVTMYPSGDLGLRPQGTRREERYPIDRVYDAAVKARVASEKAAKRKAKTK